MEGINDQILLQFLNFTPFSSMTGPLGSRTRLENVIYWALRPNSSSTARAEGCGAHGHAKGGGKTSIRVRKYPRINNKKTFDYGKYIQT
ncbi:hypothetical protein RND71_038193 [Anisodus tanguticus]|uniref:Uncharacterized protein n=1 Tax=Anisodus tanguticus TaxID=243964 RepID=A0AAE1R269_9SOLA|nr:hypothetical protein RND71_038193 [Anisodus tanguticus]